MTSRPYTPHDYCLISSWYLERGLVAPPPQSLPPTGLLVFKGEIPVGAAFLYRTDSSIAWIDCLITSPSTVKVSRVEAMTRLLEELSLIAKQMGYSLLIAAPTHPNVAPFLKEHGFNEEPNPTKLLAKAL